MPLRGDLRNPKEEREEPLLSAFTIVTDKSKARMDLLLASDPSLPRVLTALQTCQVFAGMVDELCVAICLVSKTKDAFNIELLAVDIAHQRRGYGREMLLYAKDYCRLQGGRYVETGAGNAFLHLHALLQRLGFRVVGVFPDYYTDGPLPLVVENSILNRDMLRYRAELQGSK